MKGPRMAAPPRKRHLGGEQRRALRLLACNPFGATEAIMHVHGFTRPMLAKLIRAGLATAQSETGKAIAVGRIRITDAGRRWLENAAKSELRKHCVPALRSDQPNSHRYRPATIKLRLPGFGAPLSIRPLPSLHKD